MPVIIKETSNSLPAPEGMHSAVCVDVVDLGPQETPWGKKHKVLLVWEITARMDEGRPFTVRKRYTASLHEKSSLHKDLKEWRGRPFTAEELAAFDIENVLGAPCQVLIQHTERDGSTYADVAAVMKAAPDQKLAPSGKYTRVKNRQAADQAQPEEATIPF